MNEKLIKKKTADKIFREVGKNQIVITTTQFIRIFTQFRICSFKCTSEDVTRRKMDNIDDVFSTYVDCDINFKFQILN